MLDALKTTGAGTVRSVDVPEGLSGRLVLIRQRAESTLKDNVLPFWTRNTWDHEYGGFLTRLDRRGELQDKSEKVLMMQARMIISLSAAHSHGLTDRGYLDLARKGFEYLTSTMWDSRDGGFFFSVTRDGKPKCRRKNTDFHMYVLMALSQYYQASRRPEALQWANRVFDLIRAKACDGTLGYIEEFDGLPWPALNSEQMDLGGERTDVKTIDMHVNILEGFWYLCRVSGTAAHKQALKEVLDLIVAKGLHPQYGGTITALDREWNSLADRFGNRVTSYGMNVEAAWLMMEALDTLEIPREKYRQPVLGLIDHALQFGFDEAKGGLYAYGPETGKVAESNLPRRALIKAWWEQVEGLNAFLAAYTWTRDERYLDAFERTFDWCWNYQMDHECGDWYQDVDPDTGKPLSTDKGGEFKTAFHVSRCLIRISNALRRGGERT